MQYKKTKVLYIITGLKTGGAEILLRDINRKINKELFDVTILSLTPIGEIGEEIIEDGGKVKTLNIKFKFNPLVFFKLLSFVRKSKPDIMHAHLFHAVFLSRVVGRMMRVPVIISTFHSDNLGGYLKKRLLKYTDRFVNINTSISIAVANKINNKKISSKAKVQVIYNGIDLEKFIFRESRDRIKSRKDIGFDVGKKLLLSVGRLNKVKGYVYLLNSFYDVGRDYPKSNLIIIGEGKERRKIKKEINRLSLDKSVFLLGKKDNVSDYLGATDMFISTSLHEGFGIAIVEAMACGLIVVSTKVGGVPEVIEDGVSGFLVESKNSKMLAKKIKHVLRLTDEERLKITKNARKTVEEKFSIEKMVNEYESLYKKLLKKNV